MRRRVKAVHRPGRKILFSVLILFLLAAIGFTAVTNGYDYFMKKMYPLGYQDIIEKEAEKYQLDPALVYALVKAESNFDPNAKSHAGAIGLMQITPPTFQWLQTKLKSEQALTEQDLLKPETNVRYGCHLLSLLLEMYPEKKTAICAYNAGIGAVNGWLADSANSLDGKNLRHIPYPETEHYSAAVLKNYEIYQKLYHF